MYKTAVILAAGLGSRFDPSTSREHKALAIINGSHIIERVIKQLSEFEKVREIIVVLGHMKLKFYQVCNRHERVRIVTNAMYTKTNNMYSCFLALEHINQLDDVIIINGDCIFSDEIISKIVAAENSLILCDSENTSLEAMKAYVSDGRITKLGKELDLNDSNVFVSLDAYAIEQKHKILLMEAMERYFSDVQFELWNEVAINEILAEAYIYSEILDEPKWYEIDTPEDYRAARSLFDEK